MGEAIKVSTRSFGKLAQENARSILDNSPTRRQVVRIMRIPVIGEVNV